MDVRPATQDDVSACVAMIEKQRSVYETFEPRFWRKAEGSAELSEAWFAHLFSDDGALSLVAEEDGKPVGFLIATDHPAPPVYDPGGPTAMIDDFCVASPERWTDAGEALLEAARAALKKRGYVQIVVVSALKDDAKAAFLRTAGLSVASTWSTAAL